MEDAQGYRIGVYRLFVTELPHSAAVGHIRPVVVDGRHLSYGTGDDSAALAVALLNGESGDPRMPYIKHTFRVDHDGNPLPTSMT